MTKNSILMIAILVVTVCSAPQAQAKSWWEYIFPGMTTYDETPARTLRAPFADDDAVIVDEKELSGKGLPDNTSPLYVRHRTAATVASWLQQVVADKAIYHANNYKAEYKAKAGDFDKAGLAEYIKFLEASGIWKALSVQSNDVTGFVSDVPILLKEGVINGRYRWLFETNIMVSYFPKGITKYDNVASSINQTQQYVITLQVGRQKGVKNEHGLQIESWSAKLKKKQ